MYIHIGNNRYIRSEELIGIFDIDTTSISRHTRRFLHSAEKRGAVESTTAELPRSFVVAVQAEEKWSAQNVYLTQISTKALRSRAAHSGGQAGRGG